MSYCIYTRKAFVLFFLLYTLPSCAQQQAIQKTEILWDHYGVPHIYAKSVNEMYYAFGWAQMHNHANLLLKLYGQARGRAAEYWGKDMLQSDQEVYLFNLSQIAKKAYSQQKPEYKAYLDAFVKGVNAYATKNPETIAQNVKSVLPVTVEDVMAHSARVICLNFLGGDDIADAFHTVSAGSNAAAIAPARSASKNAMLITNPHLPWGDFFLFFEAHLNAPGFSAYGVSLIGQPELNIAFNNNLGWTHTVNTIDASDRYILTLKDKGYMLDGIVQPFEVRTDTLKIKQPNGSVASQPVTFYYTKQGPVVGMKEGKAYAVRIAGLDNAFITEQYHKMAAAKDLPEFESAVKMLQNPMFNVIYADKDGHIMYLFNGDVPKRPEGDWDFWHRTIDGTRSKYIWTQYHTYNELPKVVDPPSGFVQNANDAPWSCTYPEVLKPQNFPPYMSPRESLEWRPQRSINLFRKDSSITFDKLVSDKLNAGLETADRFLDDLLDAVNKYPDPVATKAATILKAWDRSANTNSKGAVLFIHWFEKMNGAFAHAWTENNPVSTPNGLKDPKQAVALLSEAAREVEQQYGTIDVSWGEVNRFHVGSYDLPANGGPEQYGIYRTIYFRPEGKTAYAVGGDSYVAVTEFGKQVHAMVLLSYGNATQPGSKHIGDQLELMSQKKLRPALLDRTEVEKDVEEREIF